MQSARYDTIGRGYRDVRVPDARLATVIWGALGEAASVVNVGAGTGSYEPPDREVIAVEPSDVMIGQRPSDVATAINGTAEDLPLADQSVDAALGVFTLQHWHSVERGLSEMSRVASDRIVLVTMDVDVLGELWLVRDYLPEVLQAHAAEFPSIDYLLGALPQAREMPLPVPRDCTDGFLAAFWGRPEAYLDPDIRAATSAWHQVLAAAATRALAHLRRDLTAGDWDRRYGELRHRRMLDVGVRVICSEL